MAGASVPEEVFFPVVGQAPLVLSIRQRQDFFLPKIFIPRWAVLFLIVVPSYIIFLRLRIHFHGRRGSFTGTPVIQ